MGMRTSRWFLGAAVLMLACCTRAQEEIRVMNPCRVPAHVWVETFEARAGDWAPEAGAVDFVVLPYDPDESVFQVWVRFGEGDWLQLEERLELGYAAGRDVMAAYEIPAAVCPSGASDGAGD